MKQHFFLLIFWIMVGALVIAFLWAVGGGARAATNDYPLPIRLDDPQNIYLPLVLCMTGVPPYTPTPTPTGTGVPPPTPTPTGTPTPTTTPQGARYYLWSGGILEGNATVLSTHVATCYSTNCLERWTASLNGDMVGSTYGISGTLQVSASVGYWAYFRIILAHGEAETPLVSYPVFVSGTHSYIFPEGEGPDPQTEPGDVLIFEIDRRNNPGASTLTIQYGGETGAFLIAPAAPLSPPANFIQRTVAFTSQPFALAAGDLDGDLDIDIVSLRPTALIWWVNHGSQSFSSVTIDAGLDLSVPSAGLQMVDIDRDNDLDLVAPQDNSTFAWWDNDGKGNFTRHDLIQSSTYPRMIQVADVDGDLDMDFAVVGNNLSWWENDGNQNFSRHSLSGGTYPGVEIVDLDQDLDQDLLVILATGSIWWWENDGNQGFTKQVIRTAPSTTQYKTSIRTVDFDQDGDLDLLSAVDVLDELAWWENDGGENFTHHPFLMGFNSPVELFAVDFNNDTRLDLAAAGDVMVWYERAGAGYLRHKFVLDRIVAILPVDLDQDGDVDLLQANQDDGKISWWENPLIP